MQNSKEWIDRIIARLFEVEERYLDRTITEINQLNSEIKRQRFIGFIHMGKRFIPSEFRGMRTPKTLPSLAFALMDRASELTKQQCRVDLDKSLIKQLLFQQLHQCNTLQEIRDSLPDCLVPVIPELQGINRKIQDPLYLQRSNPHAQVQYEKILPKIEFYVMSRMMI